MAHNKLVSAGTIAIDRNAEGERLEITRWWAQRVGESGLSQSLSMTYEGFTEEEVRAFERFLSGALHEHLNTRRLDL